MKGNKRKGKVVRPDDQSQPKHNIWGGGQQQQPQEQHDNAQQQQQPANPPHQRPRAPPKPAGPPQLEDDHPLNQFAGGGGGGFGKGPKQKNRNQANQQQMGGRPQAQFNDPQNFPRGNTNQAGRPRFDPDEFGELPATNELPFADKRPHQQQSQQQMHGGFQGQRQAQQQHQQNLQGDFMSLEEAMMGGNNSKPKFKKNKKGHGNPNQGGPGFGQGQDMRNNQQIDSNQQPQFYQKRQQQHPQQQQYRNKKQNYDNQQRTNQRGPADKFEEQKEDAQQQYQQHPQHQQRPRKEKRPPKNMEPFSNPSDDLFQDVMSTIASNSDIDQEINKLLVEDFESNQKQMRALHRYIQDELIFPKVHAPDLVARVMASAVASPNQDASQSLIVQLEEQKMDFNQQLLKMTERDLLEDSIQQAVMNNCENFDMDQFDLLAQKEKNLPIDSVGSWQSDNPELDEDKVDDAMINEMLQMVEDPFADLEDVEPSSEEMQNQIGQEDPAIEEKHIIEGLNQLKEISEMKDVNNLVNQAIQTQQEKKLKAEQKQMQDLMDKIKIQQQNMNKQIEQPQQQAEASDSDDDQEIKVIIKKKVDEEILQKQKSTDPTVGVQAQPFQFNHAVSMQNQINQLKQQEDQEEEPEVQAAIIDDMPMDDFDQLLPEHNRAIVYPFEMDVFQKRAVYRLEQGQCVFVAAHTSAGKTVVAEYAIALSLKHMTKTIFTSPIKALSNQKFRDFKQKFEDVGILTGDVSINRDATCVIMTTEVLQNQVYNDSDYLQDVEWVIFDEVHYIDDPDRGSVWEEVIMKLPDHISIVMLSATVGNYMQFAEWVGRTKKKTIYVQCTYQRPVPLEHFMIYKEKLTVVKKGEENLDRDAVKKVIITSANDAKQQKFGGGGGHGAGGNKKIDRKAEAIKHKQAAIQKTIDGAMKEGQGLNTKQERKHEKFFKNLHQIKTQHLLPCVVFVFSKAQVESLASDVDDNMNFVTDRDRKEIKEFKKKALQRLDDGDRDLPQIIKLCDLLDKGIGFHHAGMIPILKEIVEILFTDGLLKVVFATSTFAIGLNMPAKSVVFTQQKKHNGQKLEVLSATEYLQMAGRAGRRGKDDRGASILCIDNSFGSVPHSEELSTMFDNKGKDLESKLKMTYKTNLSLLNQEGQDFDSLITNSFFSDEIEKSRLQAIARLKTLVPRFDKVSNIQCDNCEYDQMKSFFDNLTELRNLNVDIEYQCGLRPVVCRINLIMTPTHRMKHAIVLGKVLQKVKKGKKASQKLQDQWLVLVVQNEDDRQVQIEYDEDQDYEAQLQQAQKNLETLKQSKLSGQFRRKGGQNQKVEGFELGYHYEYAFITISDVVEVYKNELKVDQKFVVTNNQVTQNVLKNVISGYDEIIKQKGLDPIRPSKGKEVKQMQTSRQMVTAQLQESPCFKCSKLAHHLTQFQRMNEVGDMISECQSLCDSQSNEKQADFEAKNKVLQEYKMIDEDQNMLFKGKVARVVGSVDPILLTQLIFSGWLKKINDYEMLALLSVLIEQVKASKEHKMLESRISDNFWEACLFLEDECDKLIGTEARCGVNDQIQDKYKRLNYYFYEIVYDWAKKKSFLQIKTEHPGLEEGVVIKCILSVGSLCRTVKDMSNLIGDAALADRMDVAAELLKREIMSTQSLYFQ